MLNRTVSVSNQKKIPIWTIIAAAIANYFCSLIDHKIISFDNKYSVKSSKEVCTSTHSRSMGQKHSFKKNIVEKKGSRRHEGRVNGVVDDKKGNTVSGSEDGTIVSWTSLGVRKQEWVVKSAVTRIAHDPITNRVYAATRDGNVRSFLKRKENESAEDGVAAIHTSRVTGLCNPRKDLICTGGRDNAVCTLDAETLEIRRRVVVPRNLVTDLCTIDHETIAQTSEDLTLRVWDVRKMDTRRPAQVFDGFQFFAIGVAADDDGRYLLTTSKGDNSKGCEARLFDRRKSGDGGSGLVRTLRGHTRSTTGCAFLPGRSDRAVTVSLDGTARLWELAKGKCLGVIEGADDGAGLTCLANSKHRTSLSMSFGTESGEIRAVECVGGDRIRLN